MSNFEFLNFFFCRFNWLWIFFLLKYVRYSDLIKILVCFIKKMCGKLFEINVFANELNERGLEYFFNYEFFSVYFQFVLLNAIENNFRLHSQMQLYKPSLTVTSYITYNNMKYSTSWNIFLQFFMTNHHRRSTEQFLLPNNN